MSPWKYLLIFLISLRVFWAFWFPITADEAYFWQWGYYPDWTYYDHGPIAGWWMWLVHLISSSQNIGWARLTSFLVQMLLAFVLVRFGLKNNREQQKWGWLFLMSTPAWALNFLFSTDSPLFIFAILSVVFYLKAIEQKKLWLFILTGLMLGLGLWSKYLIILVGLGIGFHFLFTQRKLLFWRGLGGLLIGFLPLLGLHLLIAQTHCWWPLQFNLFNRQNKGTTSLSQIYSALAMQLILIPPWLIFKMYKWRKSIIKLDTYPFPIKPTAIIFLISFLFLIILSHKESGLHWGLSIAPLFYLIALQVDHKSIINLIKYNMIYTLTIYVLLAGITVSLPWWYQKERYYADYVLGRYGVEVHLQLVQTAKEQNINKLQLGTMGYTTAALLHYASQTPYLSFKDISPHGRNADLWHHYSTYEGDTFLILSTYSFKEEEKKEFAQYFKSTHYQDLTIKEGQFYLLIGREFNSQNFSRNYQTWAKQKFYQFPEMLITHSQCQAFK